jgi:hypothetical protein
MVTYDRSDDVDPKRTVQAVFASIAAFALPAPVQGFTLVDGDEAGSGSVQFARPARVCALARIDPALIALVQRRTDTELQSISESPSPLLIHIEDAIKSEMRNGGDAALYDALGEPLIQIFETEGSAFVACVKEKDAVVLRVEVTNNHTGKPYRVIAAIRQGDKQVSGEFARNALEELDEYQGSASVERPKLPYLRPGIGWSVDWDTKELLTVLLSRVSWTNYGPYGDRRP